MKKLLLLLLVLSMAITSASAVTWDTEDGNVLLAVGGSFVYARDNKGVLRVWGDNQFGQLGKGHVSQNLKVYEFKTKSTELDVSQLVDIVTASVGKAFLYDVSAVAGSINESVFRTGRG